MPAAFIEHRPLSSDKGAEVKYYVIVANGVSIGQYSTQEAAKDAACASGYKPVHVARERHLQNRDVPDHWRVDPC